MIPIVSVLKLVLSNRILLKHTHFCIPDRKQVHLTLALSVDLLDF